MDGGGVRGVSVKIPLVNRGLSLVKTFLFTEDRGMALGNWSPEFSGLSVTELPGFSLLPELPVPELPVESESERRTITPKSLLFLSASSLLLTILGGLRIF